MTKLTDVLNGVEYRVLTERPLTNIELLNAVSWAQPQRATQPTRGETVEIRLTSEFIASSPMQEQHFHA